MKVEVLKRSVIGKQRVNVGDKIEISEDDLRYCFKRDLVEPLDTEAKEFCGVKEKKAAKSAPASE